jgi:hypothetical protein
MRAGPQEEREEGPLVIYLQKDTPGPDTESNLATSGGLPDLRVEAPLLAEGSCAQRSGKSPAIQPTNTCRGQGRG